MTDALRTQLIDVAAGTMLLTAVLVLWRRELSVTLCFGRVCCPPSCAGRWPLRVPSAG